MCFIPITKFNSYLFKVSLFPIPDPLFALEKVYAVAKAFENIGEAVKNIPSNIINEYPQIPWSEIAKMRDVLTHHYFGVDDRILWDTLNDDFDEFERVASKILTENSR